MRAARTVSLLLLGGLGVPILLVTLAHLLFGGPDARALLDRFDLPPGAVVTDRFGEWQEGTKPGVASVTVEFDAAHADAWLDSLPAQCERIGTAPPSEPARLLPNGSVKRTLCEGREGDRVLWTDLWHRCESGRCRAVLDQFSFYN